MTTRYVGFNDRHLTEKLREQHGLLVSRESVRRLRRGLGLAPAIAAARPRAPPADPRGRRGALVQIDGSPFAWSGPAARSSCSWAPLTTPPARSWPCTSAPPRTSTAIPRSSSSCSPPRPAAGDLRDRLNLLVRNDRHWSLAEELAGSQYPPTSAACCKTSASPMSPRTRHKPRAASSASGPPCKIASSANCACAASPPSRPPPPTAGVHRRFQPPLRQTPGRRSARVARSGADLPLVLSCRYRRVVARDNTVHIGPAGRNCPARARMPAHPRGAELLDGRLVVLHDGVVRAQAPAPPGPFILKPRRAPMRIGASLAGARCPRRHPRPRARRPSRIPAAAPCAPIPGSRPTTAASGCANSRRGGHFSRSSKGGHFH